MPRNKLKLITLDLDDTLWPNTKVIVAAENAMWKFILGKFPDLKDSFSDVLISNIRTSLVKKDESLKYDLTRFRKEIIKDLLLDHGADESSATYYSNEGFNEFFKARNKVQLYRDAKIILERLSRKVNLISLSNGNADLNIIGISDFFIDQISSKDVQSNKPSSGHFIKALQVGKCEPHEVLHIGDCPINDIGGARNCNFNTLWFNCEKRKWEEIVPCELQAKSWKEVYQVINKNFILEKKDV
jgi:HAD superfamily hydrolase (TIGR01549 family)